MEAAINPTIDLPEITQDWGNRLLEGTHRTSCTTGPRRKEQWPHKRLTQTCPWVPRSPWQRLGSAVATGSGHWVQQCMYGTFWRRSPVSSLPPPEFGVRSNNREGTQTCPSTENWIKELLRMTSPIRKDLVSPTVSLSHQEASISLLSIPIRR